MNIVYLDWAASAIPDAEIIEAVAEITRLFFGNPSSRHYCGRQALDLAGQDRHTLAMLMGCSPGHLIFTSGGTESNNMVLRSFMMKKRKNGLVCSSIEHASLYETALYIKRQGIPVAFPVTGSDGFADPEKIYDAIDENTGAVAVMLVNNETGAIQPLEDIVKAVRTREAEFGSPIHVHTDAVQAFGRIPFDLNSLNVDSAAFSAHKLGGPKGIGALYSRKKLSPLITGGGQEEGLRAGTENTAGIHGFALAAGKRIENMDRELPAAAGLRNKLIGVITSLQGEVLNQGGKGFSPYITAAFFPPVPGEVLARTLNDRGYAVSTGSACSARNKKKTRVLENMGFSSRDAASALRISIGHSTTVQEINSFGEVLAEELEHLRKAAGVVSVGS